MYIINTRGHIASRAERDNISFARKQSQCCAHAMLCNVKNLISRNTRIQLTRRATQKFRLFGLTVLAFEIYARSKYSQRNKQVLFAVRYETAVVAGFTPLSIVMCVAG